MLKNSEISKLRKDGFRLPNLLLLNLLTSKPEILPDVRSVLLFLELIFEFKFVMVKSSFFLFWSVIILKKPIRMCDYPDFGHQLLDRHIIFDIDGKLKWFCGDRFVFRVVILLEKRVC